MPHAGAPAPPLTLPDQDDRPVTLSELRGGWVLLYWYPKADTPGCTAQAQGLRDQQDAFATMGCTIPGASFDPVDDLRAFHTKFALTFALLSDTDRSVGQAYGVAGDDGEGRHAGRIAFLIDPEGQVARRYEVSAPEMFADEVLDDLEALTDG